MIPLPQPIPNLYGVIMAGGSGLRFWPASRSKRPKQFLAMSSKRPLIVETLERLSPLIGTVEEGRHYVVAGVHHQDDLLRTCPNLSPSQVIIEPCARNTAPCVALAALHIFQQDPEAILVVSPADHHIAYPEAFSYAIQRAVEGAQAGALVTLGINPTRPETGYGYIRLGTMIHASGQRVELAHGGVVDCRHQVAAFVEKPTVDIAHSYLESGQYLWNSGVFIMRADRLLAEIKQQLPQHWDALCEIQSALGQPQYESVLSKAFSAMRSVSLDYGIMENAQCVEVVPVELGWSDVGHWAALRELYPQDAQKNTLVGQRHLCIDASQNVIFSVGENAPQVSLLGVHGLVVAYSPDALLICPVDESQRVKEVVDLLRERGDLDLV